MHFFINSIELLKILNWSKKFVDASAFRIKINVEMKILTLAAIVGHEDEKEMFAFKFAAIDNVAEPSSDEIEILNFNETIGNIDYATKTAQIEFLIEDYQLKLFYLDFAGKQFYRTEANFEYANLPPIPTEEMFNSSIDLNTGFFHYVKFCKEYLTFTDNYVYSNSETFVGRYGLPGAVFSGTVRRADLITLSPGKYDLFVGRNYVCLLNADNGLYCIPYHPPIDSYKLIETRFNADYVESHYESIPSSLGRKLGQAGFTVGRANNLFRLTSGNVEFFFLDN